MKQLNLYTRKAVFVLMSEEKSVQNIWMNAANAEKVTSEFYVCKVLHWAPYHIWFQNIFELQLNM